MDNCFVNSGTHRSAAVLYSILWTGFSCLHTPVLNVSRVCFQTWRSSTWLRRFCRRSSRSCWPHKSSAWFSRLTTCARQQTASRLSRVVLSCWSTAVYSTARCNHWNCRVCLLLCWLEFIDTHPVVSPAFVFVHFCNKILIKMTDVLCFVHLHHGIANKSNCSYTWILFHNIIAQH